VVADRADDARFLDGFLDATGVVQVACNGFLYEQVDASLRRFDLDAVVPVRGQANIERVQRFGVQHRAPVGVGASAKARRGALGAFRVNVAKRDGLRVFQLAERIHVRARDPANADEANPYGHAKSLQRRVFSVRRRLLLCRVWNLPYSPIAPKLNSTINRSASSIRASPLRS
jgi:hypothetical protein